MSFEDLRCLDIPLADKLDAYAAELRRDYPEASDAYDDMVDRLTASAATSGAPVPGDSLPPFVLTDQGGRLVSSMSLLERGPLIVSFNRGHWCSFCKLELAAIADAYDRIEAAGAGAVSIMPERAAHTRALGDAIGLPFPILTDLDNGYALRCGLMVWLGETLIKRLSNAGIDLRVVHGSRGGFVPVPATYVVAPDGRIIAGGAKPDFRRRFPVTDILMSLGA